MNMKLLFDGLWREAARDSGRVIAPGKPGLLSRALLGFALAFLSAAGPAWGATYHVFLTGSSFEPDQLSIEVGDTVIWVNDSGLEHTSTSDDGLWDSDVLEPGNPGDSFSYTFTDMGSHVSQTMNGVTFGELDYYCQFHGQAGLHGMSGSIFVYEASAANDPPVTPVNVLPANNAINQAVAVQLRGSVFSDSNADFHAASQWIVYYASNALVAVDSGEVTSGSLTNYSPAGLSEGTVYDWKVRYKDGRGAWSSYSATTRFTTLVSAAETGVGLLASYNNIANFSAPLVVTTNSMVNFTWGKSRPNRRITADNFAVRWEGSILPQFTEQYAIQFQYRGQARVWVNNQLIIDEWAGCSFSQARRGWISLVAGQLASIRVDYAGDPAGALAILRWTSPNLPLEIIPTSRLFPHAP
jgi:plastocyanin